MSEINVPNDLKPETPRLNVMSTITFCTPQQRLSKLETALLAPDIEEPIVFENITFTWDCVRHFFPLYGRNQTRPDHNHDSKNVCAEDGDAGDHLATLYKTYEKALLNSTRIYEK